MQNSTMSNNGMGDGDICAFLNLSASSYSTATPAMRANLSEQLGALLDADASWPERSLVNPLVRQYHLARCNHLYELAKQATYKPEPGSLAKLLSQVVCSGLLSCISVCFNISLIVVTFRQIKEHKVCNWLLAFDAACQLFTMATFLTNFFVTLFGISAIDFRICMATLIASVMGMHGSVLTIYLISLERILLTLAPMSMNLLETPAKVRRLSLVAMCLGIMFGLYMSCSLLLYINVLIPFSMTINGAINCPLGVFLAAINTPPNYILLLLAQLNYIIIFLFLLWRYFHGASSGESIRRVLRAVFILSLVVLVGWLVSVSFNPINVYLYRGLDWAFQQFGSDSIKSPDLFYSIFLALQGFVHWANIVASAGGAPILFFTSTEYGNAYKKMFIRTQVTANKNNGPLFIQRLHENAITTQAARDTTAVAS